MLTQFGRLSRLVHLPVLLAAASIRQIVIRLVRCRPDGSKRHVARKFIDAVQAYRVGKSRHGKFQYISYKHTDGRIDRQKIATEINKSCDASFLAERYYVTLLSRLGTSRSSVVCLSVCLSVTLLLPTQRVEFFSNIFAPTWTGCINILGKIQRQVKLQVKWKGYGKLAFFDQYLALFRKRYNGKPIVSRIYDLSTGAIFSKL